MESRLNRLEQRLLDAELRIGKLRRLCLALAGVAAVGLCGGLLLAAPTAGTAQTSALAIGKRRAKRLVAKAPFVVRDKQDNKIMDVVATGNGGKLRVFNAAGKVVVELGSEVDAVGLRVNDPSSGALALVGIAADGPGCQFVLGDLNAEMGAEPQFGAFMSVEKGEGKSFGQVKATGNGTQLDLADQFGSGAVFMSARGEAGGPPKGGFLNLRRPDGGSFIAPHN